MKGPVKGERESVLSKKKRGAEIAREMLLLAEESPWPKNELLRSEEEREKSRM